MQVRQALVASLLAVTAFGAMSQEIDPAENLQGRNLAAQHEKAQRAADAASSPQTPATASAAKTAPESQHAQAKPTHARFDLTRWHPARKATVVAAG